MPKVKKQNRLLELDVLRGLAAVSVLLHHYTARYDDFFRHAPEVPQFDSGAYGVFLFFVISGFVIFMTLEKTRNWLDFVVSRFSRLFPAYWVAVVLTFTIVGLAGLPGQGTSFAAAIANLSMLQQFARIPHVDGVYWTLTIELGFYLVMLLLYQAGLLARPNTVAVCWLGLVVGTRALHDTVGVGPPKVIELALALEFAHLFIAGIITYKIWREGFSIARVALLLGCLFAHWYLYDFGNAILVSVFVALVLAASQGWLAFIARRPLIFLGTISYSLYLIHQNIGYVIIRAAYGWGLNSFVGIVFAIVIALGTATLMTFIVEKPGMRLIRSWYWRIATKASDTADASGVGPR